MMVYPFSYLPLPEALNDPYQPLYGGLQPFLPLLPSGYRWVSHGSCLANCAPEIPLSVRAQIVMHGIATFGIRLEDSSSNNTVSSNTPTKISEGKDLFLITEIMNTF